MTKIHKLQEFANEAIKYQNMAMREATKDCAELICKHVLERSGYPKGIRIMSVSAQGVSFLDDNMIDVVSLDDMIDLFKGSSLEGIE